MIDLNHQNKKEISDLFVKALKEKFGDSIDRVILFGSVARGEDREDSDIDVLIITDYDSFKMQRSVSDIVVDTLPRTGVYICQGLIS